MAPGRARRAGRAARGGQAPRAGAEALVPLRILKDAVLAQNFAEELLEEGIYVVSFSFPVVPKNSARIRVQMSASLDTLHLDQAIEAFVKVGKKCGII